MELLCQEHDIYCQISEIGGAIMEYTMTAHGIFRKWFKDSQIAVLVMDLVGGQAASEVDVDTLQ